MSGLPFELLIALRYLRPKRTFVSIITLISVIGVMLGVSVLIIVISVMNGFDHDLRERVLGFNGHLKVSRHKASMTDYAETMSIVASNKNVIGVAPSVQNQVLIETQPPSGQKLSGGAFVRGVDPQYEKSVSILPSSIKEGEFNLSGHGLIIGSSFANAMNLEVGDHVSMATLRELEKMRDNRGKEGETTIIPDDYVVRGIFDAGYEEYNIAFVLVSLQNAQDLFDLGDSVHWLLVKIRDPYEATKVAGELEKSLGPGFEVETWLQQSSMMQAVLVEKNVMLYILFFIVLVAAFGITCTLITFIVLKTREIGVMKALGATNSQVMWVFLGQSMIVSVMGVAAGTSLGLLALHYRNQFLELMRHWTGFQLFPADIYGFSQLPSLVVPRDLLIICGGSLIICLLAAAFPAYHASRLNPVEALRNE